jgi:hypothetical protein
MYLRSVRKWVQLLKEIARSIACAAASNPAKPPRMLRDLFYEMLKDIYFAEK